MLGEERCNTLSFFSQNDGMWLHSLIFNQGKCKFRDRWVSFSFKNKLTSVFKQLSYKPDTASQEQAWLLEKYVSFVNYGIDVLRSRDFE